MKKIFNLPEVEVIAFQAEDIICVSNNNKAFIDEGKAHTNIPQKDNTIS